MPEVKSVLSEILQRQSFVYKIKDILNRFLKCYCIRNKRKPENRHHYYYDKAVKKITHNFDALSLF